MPSSSPLGKTLIKEWFSLQTDIGTIVDMGPGEGTYRNLLGPKYKWIGVEIWEANIERFKLWEKYDKVVLCNLTNYHPEPPFDCVIFGDVLEHLPKKVALKVLKDYLLFFNHVVVSIPLGKYPQGPIDGNLHEEHKSTWTFDEINSLATWKKADTFVINPDLPYLKIGVFIK